MLLVFKLLLASALSWGQNKVGNGGDVVVCSANKVTLLDLYESELEATTSESDPYVLALNNFKKLEKIKPSLAEAYQNRVKTIKDEIDFKEEVELTNIKDSKHLYKPASKDCKVEQIAIRKNLTIGKEKRFLIRKDLWNKLNPAHQAALISHEIIYEHFYKLGEQDSIKARKLNAYLYGSTVDADSFWILMKELRVPVYP